MTQFSSYDSSVVSQTLGSHTFHPPLFHFPLLSSKAASEHWRTLREKREKDM